MQISLTNSLKLGAFGFLSSTEIQQNGALNAGILDMAFALQWVQDHIDQFGGDKSRVTVAGQSAGAGGVMLLGIAKNGTLGTSLFSNVCGPLTTIRSLLTMHQIIAASPYLPPQHKFDASAPTRQYESFSTRAGCANSTETLSCLRSKDSITLQTANSDVNAANFYGHWAFAPVTEPESGFINTHPSDSLTAGLVNGEHILVGNNANEGPLFVPTIDSAKALQIWLQDAFPSVASTDFEAILAAYPSSNLTKNDTFATTGFGPVTALNTSSFASGIQQRAYNIYAEATFVCPSYWLSDAFTTNNRTAFHYQYSVPGALHGSDVSAYFGPATASQPRSFTTVFRQIWGHFVTAANPGTAKGLMDLTWPAWAEDGHSKMLNLNITGGVPYPASQLTGITITEHTDPGLQNHFTVVNALEREDNRGVRCELWRSIASKGVGRT
jgi:carboxylesterase type B